MLRSLDADGTGWGLCSVSGINGVELSGCDVSTFIYEVRLLTDVLYIFLLTWGSFIKKAPLIIYFTRPFCPKMTHPPKRRLSLDPDNGRCTNKKFGEELIVYFPLILHAPHRKEWYETDRIENEKIKGRIRGYTDTQTARWYHKPHFIFKKIRKVR
jgi:hypothetical protein